MDDKWYIVVAIAGFVGLFALIGLLTYWIGSVDCNNYSRYSSVETEYNLVSGCFVKLDDGRWMLKDQHWVEIGERGGE